MTHGALVVRTMPRISFSSVFLWHMEVVSSSKSSNSCIVFCRNTFSHFEQHLPLAAQTQKSVLPGCASRAPSASLRSAHRF